MEGRLSHLDYAFKKLYFDSAVFKNKIKLYNLNT